MNALSAAPQKSRSRGAKPGASFAPLLENGDCMDSETFLRLAERMPEGPKVELMDGIVFMSPPVRDELHARPDGLLQAWLGTYAALHQGVILLPNATLRISTKYTVQPDSMLCLSAEHGGKSYSSTDGYRTGIPELVCEVAASSVSIDLHLKRKIYRRLGAPEYLVWRTVDKALDWFFLEDGEYIPQTPDRAGLLHSRVFPGLTLDVEALLSLNGAKVIAALQKRKPRRKS